MEYQSHKGTRQMPVMEPRLVIHGGAGNILRHNFSAEEYDQYRSALLEIVNNTNDFMKGSTHDAKCGGHDASSGKRPSALEIATHAVVQLENHPLFNSGHGSVFTRDGTNELEASLMVSKGFKKRGVGVMGLRHVRNPILLARKMLEQGDQDLAVKTVLEPRSGATKPNPEPRARAAGSDIDVPSAQGHTLIYGEAAEKLAQQYGCEMVSPSYYFTQKRWDEHIWALEKERETWTSGTWDADEFLPQGTCGAVAMDEDGVICAATSTGGLTNKVTGRVGDTPIPGAGFWAGEWDEAGDAISKLVPKPLADPVDAPGSSVSFADTLKNKLDGYLPTPLLRSPDGLNEKRESGGVTTTRSIGISGTGTGDSFVRVAAARTVTAMAQWGQLSGAKALENVAGPGGELERSAGERWGETGEGEGGMIGIENIVVRGQDGMMVETRSEILMDYNCAGMYRAWVDENGEAVMSIWSNGSTDKEVSSLYETNT